LKNIYRVAIIRETVTTWNCDQVSST